jgi:hypothetical protein
MDSDTMLGIHMFGDVQAYVQVETELDIDYGFDDCLDEHPVSQLRNLIADWFGTYELTRWSDESLNAIISDSRNNVNLAFDNVRLLLDRSNDINY